MVTRLAYVAWISIWIMAGCSGAARDQPQTVANLPREGAEPADQPTLQIAAEPGEVDPASCKPNVRDRDCCDACRLVSECRPNVPYEACVSRCGRSHWIDGHDTHCLALRVFWIDEEGCSRIGPTWDGFDDADECAD